MLELLAAPFHYPDDAIRFCVMKDIDIGPQREPGYQRLVECLDRKVLDVLRDEGNALAGPVVQGKLVRRGRDVPVLLVDGFESVPMLRVAGHFPAEYSVSHSAQALLDAFGI